MPAETAFFQAIPGFLNIFGQKQAFDCEVNIIVLIINNLYQ
jgi:hypothetical protein